MAPEPRKRRKLLDVIPGIVYTEPNCMEVIKKRDKNAKDDYVEEYEKEVQKGLKEIEKRNKIGSKTARKTSRK